MAGDGISQIGRRHVPVLPRAALSKQMTGSHMTGHGCADG